MVYFPSREGIKGCVTVRGAVEAKEFLEVRFLSFNNYFYFKWLCADVTHPRPLSIGEF